MLTPCKDCKDRVVVPNCHSTCEKYLEYKKYINKLKEARELYTSYRISDKRCKNND